MLVNVKSGYLYIWLCFNICTQTVSKMLCFSMFRLLVDFFVSVSKWRRCKGRIFIGVAQRMSDRRLLSHSVKCVRLMTMEIRLDPRFQYSKSSLEFDANVGRYNSCWNCWVLSWFKRKKENLFLISFALMWWKTNISFQRNSSSLHLSQTFDSFVF